MNIHHWLGARLLGIPKMHEEEFQVLLDMTLSGQRKFNLAARLHECLQGPKGLHVLGHTGPGQRGSDHTPANTRMRFWGFEHACLDPTLAPGWLPHLTPVVPQWLPGPTISTLVRPEGMSLHTLTHTCTPLSSGSVLYRITS